jgi:hypothetical protein
MASKRQARAKSVNRIELQRDALELRKQGKSPPEIGEEIGTSRSYAHELVKGALDDLVKEPSEQVLKLELSRLDAILNSIWKKVRAGDVQSIDRALRIMERRAAYLGIDAPKSMHFDVSKLTNDQLQQIISGCAPEAASAGDAGAAEAPEDREPSEDEGTGA